MASRRFEDLVALMARLRAPDGCPWDRQQTARSLRTYLLEETYEVLDAIERNDAQALQAELGDLLLQVLFLSQIAREEQRFTIDDVLSGLHEKLVRRHPHVFGPVRADTAEQVVKNWEALKAEERDREEKNAGAEHHFQTEAGPAGAPTEVGVNSALFQTKTGGLLAGVPRTLPALLEAYQLTRRAAQVGFDWPTLEGLLGKLSEELGELRAELAPHPPEASGDTGQAAGSERARLAPPTPLAAGQSPANGGAAGLEGEVGDLLFVVVNLARHLKIDPEIALRQTNQKFVARFRQIEQELQRRGKAWEETSLEEMDALWEASKQREAQPRGKTPRGKTRDKRGRH
ncbi:MAG: nucleoside triphosphate pyrophosphohydrolase [Terriglobia bacterium]